MVSQHRKRKSVAGQASQWPGRYTASPKHEVHVREKLSGGPDGKFQNSDYRLFFKQLDVGALPENFASLRYTVGLIC